MNGVVSGQADWSDLGDHPPPSGPYPMGIMGVLATVAMLFAAFTAAILVRRTGTDWTRVALPTIVWMNTGLLVASSVALERARAQLRRGASDHVWWLGTVGVLGGLFLAGPVVAWRTLAAQGVFLPSTCCRPCMDFMCLAA